MNKELLSKKQPIVYKVLENGLINKTTAHAYLFTGVSGSLQQEMATLLVQSLLCESSNPWACESCSVCTRVSQNNFSDMVVLDGTKQSIKKGEILDLQSKFSRTALEVYGKKIYIILKAESMTREAMNALLKFLEEPSNDVIGILISENETSLLPTIVSRCQTLNFKKLSYHDIYEHLILSHDTLISYFYAKIVGTTNGLKEDEVFNSAYQALLSFLEVFYRDQDYGLLIIHQTIFSMKDKSQINQTFHYFLDMLIIFYNDIINRSDLKNEDYELMLGNYRRHTRYTKHLAVLLDTKKRITRSTNLPLIADQMVYKIKEENNE